MSETFGPEHEPPPRDLNAEIDETHEQPPEKSFFEKLGKKAGMLLGGMVVILLVGMVYFTLRGSHVANSSVPTAPSVNNIPGTHAETSAYRQQVLRANAEQAAAAERDGGSAFPTPDYMPPPASGKGGNSNTAEETAPPASTPNLDATSETTQGVAPPERYARQPGSSKAYARAIDQVLRHRGSHQNNFKFVVASDLPPPPEPRRRVRGTQAARQAAKLAANGISLPQPGTLLPARMINGLDSDDPGPAIALVTGGVLKGARVIGSFTTARAGLVLRFTKMSIPVDGGRSVQTVSISADAITLTKDALATSVNDHLIGNLAVLFASSLANSAGQLVSESGTTLAATGTGTVLQSMPQMSGGQILGSAAGQALGQAGQEYEQMYGNRPPTIKLAPGTPFTLAFVGGVGKSRGLANLHPITRVSQMARPGIQYAAPVGFGGGYNGYGGLGSPLGMDGLAVAPGTGQ